MADILIRMEMPKDCGKCFVGDRTMCSDGCPLHELPPHGDLIDKDALMADGWRLYKGAIMQDGSYATHEMPLSNPGVIVVIPSNKEETDADD